MRGRRDGGTIIWQRSVPTDDEKEKERERKLMLTKTVRYKHKKESERKKVKEKLNEEYKLRYEQRLL